MALCQPATPPASPDKPTSGKLSAKAATNSKVASTKPADAPVTTVTVTAAPQTLKSSIDRRSYSLANDLQKTSGSIGDALRNVPSVEVDVQGGISLRGDSNVTILVDGQPSALFSGPNRADALQQLPADQYDRVEVLTNPSAAFKPDGTAGIINLITKKNRSSANQTGSVKANLGTDGRYNAGLNGSYSVKGLSLSGGASYRYDTSRSDSSTTYQFPDPITGALTPAHSTGQNNQASTSVSLYGSGDYDLDSKTRLSANLNHFQGRFDVHSTEAYRSDALTGPLALDYDTTGRFNGRYSADSGSATYLRKFSGQDHELSIRLSLNQFQQSFANPTAFTYQQPVQPDLFQNLSTDSVNRQAELKAEYKVPLPNKAKLVTGYEAEIDWDRFGHLGLLGTTPANAAINPALTNVFKFDQQVHALYATYEQSFGKLTALPGLRLEEVVIDTDQVTTRSGGGQDYFSAYPTLHLSYELDEHRQLKASYSRRVQRPSPQAFNPFRVYNSPTSFSEGNPGLMPEVTQSYELGYEFRKKKTYYLATLYYRDNAQLFTPIVRNLGGGVLLNTTENLGHSRNAGLELVANGQLTKTLSFNASTSLFWNEINAANLGILQTRSAFLMSGRANVNWQVTKTDFVQLNAYAFGKQLTAQGYRTSFVSLNLGWRHKFDEKLAGVVTVQDPFDSSRQRSVTDTPTLKEQTYLNFHRRGVFIGLTYALGSPNKRTPETFDFSGGASPAPQQ